MKYYKKITCAVLAFVLACTSLMSAPFVFADNGRDNIVFSQSYYEMISSIQQKMKERENDISVSFDLLFADDNINYTEDEAEAIYGVNTFYNYILEDIYKLNTDDPALGDYLFNSVTGYETGGITHAKTYTDTSYSQHIGYRFNYTLHFDYYTNREQEKRVEEFSNNFRRQFKLLNASEYLKVKTIYDFIVKNTDYDDEVRVGRFCKAHSTDRFKISHSAFGAIYGNMLTYNDEGMLSSTLTVTPESYVASVFDDTVEEAASGEAIIKKSSQGLAVCEGFSKLFYYLCKANGVDCHIVDGDYDASVGVTDPHEWNYVRLDDGMGDGYKWFYVDSTYSEQHTQKFLECNNYHYFLRGTANPYFAINVHPQPYHNKGMGENEKDQLYDWYNEAWYGNSPVSDIDYRFGKATVSKDALLENGVVLTRLSDYGDGVQKAAYLYIDSNGCISKTFDESGNPIDVTVEGFEYNGINADYTFSIPYYVDEEYSYQVVSGADANTNGDYYAIVIGENSECTIPFNVVPLDMSKDEFNSHYDPDKTRIQDKTYFNNEPVTPQVMITDTHEHKLEKDRDFDISYEKYTDSALVPVEGSSIREMGLYKVLIRFKGNYSGVYDFDFLIDKALLSRALFNTEEYEYIPRQLRQNASIQYQGESVSVGNLDNPKKIFEVGLLYGGVQLTANGIPIFNNVDYTITGYSGNINFNDTGYVTITGKQGSENLVANDSVNLNYKVSKRYDVSRLNGTYADSNTVNKYYFNGAAHKPVKFDKLDETLIKGTEYKITGYSDCTNAGVAKVHIAGIPENGTTGAATLYYVINRVSITDCVFSYKGLQNGNVVFAMTHGSRTLVKGTDYTVTQSKTDTGYKLVIKGVGNYSGTSNVDLRVDVSPTGGNTSGGSSGSSSTTTTTTNTTTVVNKVVKIVMKIPKITYLKSKKKKQLRLQYTKPGGSITGYQIQYSLKKNFKGAKTYTFKGANTRSITIKKLKRKKKYYVRVRTYYKGKTKTYYSKWSTVKSTKVK